MNIGRYNMWKTRQRVHFIDAFVKYFEGFGTDHTKMPENGFVYGVNNVINDEL